MLVVWLRERLRDGDFVDGVFRERNANGVADAVREQRADADGALDPAILPIARLGHSEMDRVIPVRALRVESGD